jgi:hypothetical protein
MSEGKMGIHDGDLTLNTFIDLTYLQKWQHLIRKYAALTSLRSLIPPFISLIRKACYIWLKRSVQ